jgi:hypothetical protein
MDDRATVDDTLADAARLAEIQRNRAERIAAMWLRPALPEDDVPLVLSYPPSSWAALKASGNAPRSFRIGRRCYYLTADLRAWLERRAEAAAAAA